MSARPKYSIGGRVRQELTETFGVTKSATTEVTTSASPKYDASEQDVLMREFVRMLKGVTKDGGRKRATGSKPPWWKDSSHEAAIFSHINKWKHGEKSDSDSGQHPLVHCAWRCLAIAYQETVG